MPLSDSTTPVNSNQREHVLPLLDKVKLKTTTPNNNVLTYINEVFNPKYQNESGKQRKAKAYSPKSLLRDSSNGVVWRCVQRK
ncbi:hypothetical protein BZZ01_10965 [Nostocales cyanobacterium HT-58-2]|nr:hypothetical protein BZZ01_10965 [Nostocales cyanobacterium HT-58-2]